MPECVVCGADLKGISMYCLNCEEDSGEYDGGGDAHSEWNEDGEWVGF